MRLADVIVAFARDLRALRKGRMRQNEAAGVSRPTRARASAHVDAADRTPA
jgi:hypothetical protein